MESRPSLGRSLIKKFYLTFVYPWIVFSISKTRPYNYKGFKLIVFKGVFHPGFFFSTKFFYSFIHKLNLHNKLCLEVGCGSGLLSLLMLKKGGKVTSIDIDDNAIQNTKANYEKNKTLLKSELTVVQSDLFTNVPQTKFDFIFINPPYYFEDPVKDSQLAWFCGKNGDYFIKLFAGIKFYTHPESTVYMTLADNCDIQRIRDIALEHGLKLDLETRKRIWWEDNYIFKLNSSTV
jgi:release factor glutamine methyltransferase